MRHPLALLAFLAVFAIQPFAHGADEPKVAFPGFKMQELAKDLQVGYAVLLADINGDGKPDIVVVDSKRVIWFENPTWKMRTIIGAVTQPDNVCISAYDIDGDGQLDLALGAAWNPGDTKGGGTLQWLKRGKTLDDPWTVHPIDSEPTVHRIRFADLDGSGKAKLVVVPLFGRNSSKTKNWMDQPVRILAYSIPKDPTKDRWTPDVINNDMHVIHNFWPIPATSGKGLDVLCASYEGVSLLTRGGDKWERKHIGAGNQDNPMSNRGASEIKQGKLKNGKKYIATIEPWHGNQVVVYTQPKDPTQKLWDRHVIDDQLRWGHGVWCADLDGDGDEELIIGVRDEPGPKDTFKERRGVRIYKATDETGSKWARQIIDNGDMSCEDLAAVDLDGDGKIDIVAVGRFTHNVRIYWNQGVKK
jgi:hypothetical protein